MSCGLSSAGTRPLMYLPCQHYTRQLARSSVNLSRRRTRGFSYRHELRATLYLHDLRITAIRLWFGRKQDVSCPWHSRQFLRGHPFRFQLPSPRSCCHHIRHGGHADSTRMDRLRRLFAVPRPFHFHKPQASLSQLRAGV